MVAVYTDDFASFRIKQGLRKSELCINDGEAKHRMNPTMESIKVASSKVANDASNIVVAEFS